MTPTSTANTTREAFKQQQPAKQPMMPTEFNARIKEVDAAIVGMDTDAFDLRQRMEPFLDNPHLNHAQRERVKVSLAKLLKVLTEHGLIDAWGFAIGKQEEEDTKI